MQNLTRFLITSQESLKQHLSDPQFAPMWAIANDWSDKFQSVIERIRIDNLTALILQASAQNAHMSAISMAFSGQTTAVFASSRTALEASLFSLVVSQSKENFDRWANPPKEHRKKIRATEGLALLDGAIPEAQEIRITYENLIALGAHPNKAAISRNATFTKEASNDFVSLAAVHGPSRESAVRIAMSVSCAALSCLIAGEAIPGYRDELQSIGRDISSRMLSELKASEVAAPAG